jgi:hypothetical protein
MLERMLFEIAGTACDRRSARDLREQPDWQLRRSSPASCSPLTILALEPMPPGEDLYSIKREAVLRVPLQSAAAHVGATRKIDMAIVGICAFLLDAFGDWLGAVSSNGGLILAEKRWFAL